MKYLFIIFTAVTSVFSQLKEMTILHWNDFHARNQPYEISAKDSIGNEVRYYVGGTASLYGYLNKYRDDKSLVLNAGDDFQGTPISSLTRGRSQIEFMNYLEPHAFVLGNHEFDYGQYSLDSALTLAKFDVLSANVYFSPYSRLFAKPFVIKEINGIKTGIIGITLPELFETSLPDNVKDLVMLDTDSVIAAAINELKANNCDLIIILSHCGIEKDKTFASMFYKDVDIIIGGHSHTALFKPVIQNGVIIVQAGAHGRYLGILEISVDTDKDTVLSFTGKLIETVLNDEIYDHNIAAIVDRRIDELMPDMKLVIGTLESDWKASYSEESNLGQYQADAFRIRTGSDIAFINGGGLRKSLLKGDIIVQDIWEINPFGNEIITFKVSGKILRQMIKNNILIRTEKQRKGSNSEILHTSGLNYSYSSKKAMEGDTDFLITLNLGRAEINDESEYVIATNNYVTAQFKKFFGEIDAVFEFKRTGLIDRDVIIEKIKEDKVINTVLEKRITDVDKN